VFRAINRPIFSRLAFNGETMGKPGPDRRVSHEMFLREMALCPDPIVTAKEMAERLDYSRAGVNNIFDELVTDGYVGTRRRIEG